MTSEAPSPTETRLTQATKALKHNRDPQKRTELLNEFWNASTAWWRENMPHEPLDVTLEDEDPSEHHYTLNH